VGVLAVGAIVAVIVVSARSKPPATMTQPTWTLTMLVVDGQEQALSSSRAATLHFGAHDGQISGSGGCNTFGGSYTLHGIQLQISMLRSTLIACSDPVLSAQDSHYFQALPRVATYRLEGNTLTLSGDSGQVQLTFRAS
jgi:heat shock protein HslJ